MNVVSDDILLEIRKNIDEAMEIYSKHDFLNLSIYETDDLIKRQIDNYHDLESRGLKEIIKKFRVLRIKSAVLNNETSISLQLVANLEHYIIRTKDEEVVEGIREYITETLFDVKMKKNDNSIINECEYCGAKLSVEDRKCPYCNTPVMNKEKEWLISDISEIKTKNFHDEYINAAKQESADEWNRLYKEWNKGNRFRF